MDNVVEAYLELEFGVEILDSNICAETLKRAAYHEAGHALVTRIF